MCESEDGVTILHLGRKRFVLTFRVESNEKHETVDLERLAESQRTRREDLSRRTRWELEQALSGSRAF